MTLFKAAGLFIAFAHVVSAKTMPNRTVQVSTVDGKQHDIPEFYAEDFWAAYGKWEHSMSDEGKDEAVGKTIDKYIGAFPDVLNGVLAKLRVETGNEQGVPLQAKPVKDRLTYLVGIAEFRIEKHAELKKWLTAAGKISAKYTETEPDESGEDEIQVMITDFYDRMDYPEIGA